MRFPFVQTRHCRREPVVPVVFCPFSLSYLLSCAIMAEVCPEYGRFDDIIDPE